jgi:exopolyphosphatase/guanosine-5'-triphosphate,3'-diphosphate pyrophosphatase
MSKEKPNLFAAIHVGSEQVSAQIVEYHTLHDIKIVELASRQVSLGEETFKTGRISFGAVNEICDLLKGYKRLLTEYGVRDYRLVATTAIREAENQQYIIDQIKVKTGFAIQVIDMTQEIFYKYISLFKTVQDAGLVGREGILFVDISSGGLGITLYKDGILKYQQNIHIGILRVKESFDKYQRESTHFQQALNEYIYSVIEPVKLELERHKIKYLVLSGTETRLLLTMLAREPVNELSFVSLADFYKLYEQVKPLNLPQIVKNFNISEQKSEMVLPTIVLYKQILSLTTIGEIVIPGDQFIDGITAIHIAEKTKCEWLCVIEEQIVSLAQSLGRKYRYDLQHAANVEKMSLSLFDRLAKAHGLGKRERLLLQVAAILHDIGKFVSLRRHYFYSYRLIVSSDILGVSEEEKIVIANVAYYHSKGTPTNADPNFADLTREQKVTVAKLAAIIRLADAVDRTHLQKVTAYKLNLKGEELIISVESENDLSLEEWTFIDKADFFENVFGIKATLQRSAKTYR